MRQPEWPDDADTPLRLCYTGPSPTRERQQAIERRFALEIVCGYALSESPYGLIWPRGSRPFGTLVAEAAVIGVPSDLSEQDVKAFVVAAAGRQLDVADVDAHLRRLTRYKVPRYYYEVVTPAHWRPASPVACPWAVRAPAVPSSSTSASPRDVRGVVLIARTVGLVAHLAEEADRPIGMPLWLEVERRSR